MLIGIDLGTTAVKVLAMDKQGNILCTATEEYPLYVLNNNHTEQDPNDWLNATKKCMDYILTQTKTEPLAISFSGQMHGLVVLDEFDNVIRNAILWNDQRTVSQCEYLNKNKDILLQETANIALTGFTAPKILWLKENEPENFKKIAKIMLPKDFLAYKLTGVFATDYSDASGTLLLDVKNKCWSKKMLEIIGINENQLPKLFNSYEVIGTYGNAKVIIGGGDQAVGAIATGVTQDGLCSISLGTSGVVFLASDNFSVDTSPAAIHSFCHATGKYHLMGVTLAAAGSIKWWMENILLTDNHEKEQQGDTSKVYFLPYLSGERTPHNNPNARGVFFGMDTTTTREDMTLAVLEGVAFSLRDILQAMNKSVTTARIIGGGAKSDKWCQVVSDILNMKVERIHSNEGPALGAAILASVGAGIFENVQEACTNLIRTTDSFLPRQEYVKIYVKRYKIYKDLYIALKGVFNER